MQGRRDGRETGTNYRGPGRSEGDPALRKGARSTKLLPMILSFHVVSLGGARGGVVG
jgi:hypothetical protein